MDKVGQLNCINQNASSNRRTQGLVAHGRSQLHVCVTKRVVSSFRSSGQLMPAFGCRRNRRRPRRRPRQHPKHSFMHTSLTSTPTAKSSCAACSSILLLSASSMLNSLARKTASSLAPFLLFLPLLDFFDFPPPPAPLFFFFAIFNRATNKHITAYGNTCYNDAQSAG